IVSWINYKIFQDKVELYPLINIFFGLFLIRSSLLLTDKMDLSLSDGFFRLFFLLLLISNNYLLMFSNWGISGYVISTNLIAFFLFLIYQASEEKHLSLKSRVFMVLTCLLAPLIVSHIIQGIIAGVITLFVIR